MQNRDARDAQVNNRRNFDNNDVPVLNNGVEFPAPVAQLPPIDMNEMNRLCQAVSDGEEVDSADVMKQTLSMMMHMAQSMTKIDKVKNEVKNNSSKIAALEAKVGGSDEVATALGLAIQNLPPSGQRR